MKKYCAALFAAAGFVTPAPAVLLITDINSNSNVGAAQIDFWELTNAGPASINLSNWVWDDSTNSFSDPKAAHIPDGISIASGESVVFIVLDSKHTEVTVADFRTAWNLSSDVQIIASADPGLGKDDAINLFDATGVAQPSLSYAAGGFTQSSGAPAAGGHAGSSAGGASTSSLIIDPTFGIDSPRYTAATGANFDSVMNAAGQFGSPGFSGITPVPEPGAVALMTLGLGFVGWQTRRLRARA